MELFFIFVIFLGIAIFRTIWGERKDQELQRHPPASVRAQVVTKYYSRKGDIWGQARSAHLYLYYVIFELETGERKQLETEKNQYLSLKEGDQGILTYQRDSCLNFQ